MPQTCHSCHTTDTTFFGKGGRVADGAGAGVVVVVVVVGGVQAEFHRMRKQKLQGSV